MNAKSVSELARLMDLALVYNEERKIHLLRDGSPEWMTDVILGINVDTDLDSLYDATNKLVSVISECDTDASENDLMDALNEVEPDVYTADLTAWLARNVNHAHYLTSALEDFEPKDGFNLLAIAQSEYLNEVGAQLIAELQKVADETETIANDMDAVLDNLKTSDFDYIWQGDTNVYSR